MELNNWRFPAHSVTIGVDFGAQPPQDLFFRKAPMTASEVMKRYEEAFVAPGPSPLKAQIDRLFDIIRKQKLAAVAPAAPPEPSPLPPGLFSRMERNRSARVAGAAHFVEMD